MTDGFVIPPVRGWLRLEGGAVLVAAVGAYYLAGNSWILFAVLFLAPDLSFLGYLAGPRFGTVVYNVAHTYVGPAVLALAATATGGSVAVPLIWAAHIGMDRMVGYGLKYPSAFQDTHLGRIGRG